MRTKMIEIEVPADDGHLFERLAQMLRALDSEGRYFTDAENMRGALWEQVHNAGAVAGIKTWE